MSDRAAEVARGIARAHGCGWDECCRTWAEDDIAGALRAYAAEAVWAYADGEAHLHGPERELRWYAEVLCAGQCRPGGSAREQAAVQQEREACAKVAERYQPVPSCFPETRERATREIAAAIRARGAEA